jgi:hypothetical protein
MGAFGLAPTALTDSGAVLAGIRSIRRVFPGVASVFLIGGDAIVPHFRLPNPTRGMPIDPDVLVYSDNPYGADEDTLDAYIAPALPVGRLCEPAGDASAFVEIIERVVASHTARRIRAGSMSVINEEWIDASTRVMASLSAPLEARLAPGFVIDAAGQPETAREYLYFNLHGFDDDAAWKAFDRIRGQFVSVATPESFDRRYVADAFVFAENCYGALTVGKDEGNSCALRLVREGVAAFVGATGLAFGSLIQPDVLLDNADLLAARFFDALIGERATVGSALVRARSAFLNETAAAALNVFHQKTLLQFTLLGDPSLS